MRSAAIHRAIPAALGFLLLTLNAVAAQQAGRIVGRVVDVNTGAGISAVSIEVIDDRGATVAGGISGVDGRFVIQHVPAGTVTLRATSIGYGSKNVSGVAVVAGGSIEQDITLEAQAVRIGAIEVTAAAERGSVSRALDQQRTATGIVNSVTAEQISRSPDGDAAAAVQRVSGVTLQDNRFPQVRGLGERYTTASLNGARIPSPEPEKKMVPLDLFPSGLLETIVTSKTFTPDQPGDFSGAAINIKTREFPARRTQAVSTSIGFNSAATGRTMILAPSRGLEWLGFGSRERGLPDPLRAAGNFQQPFTRDDINGMLRSFNNVWSASADAGRPNASLGMILGGNGEVFGRPLGYVLSGTYSHAYEIRDREVRAIALPDVNGGTTESDRFTGSTGRTSALWGGVLNLSTLLGSHSRIAINSSYNRSADNEARFEVGRSENHGMPLQVTRLRYVERSVASVQLLGQHQLGGGHRFDWSTTASSVSRNEPDRSEVVYAIQTDPATGEALAPAWFSGAPEGAVRTFGELSERAWESAFDYRFDFDDALSFVKIGGLIRSASRDADNRAYSVTAPTLTQEQRQLRPERIFAELQTDPDPFRIEPLLQGGSYRAEDQLLAGYAMAGFSVWSRLRVTVGARVEQSRTDVDAAPTIGRPVRTTPEYTDVLPSLTLNFILSDRQNLRFSASRTLSRPEYREMAPVTYRDVIGGDNIVGNPDLRRTLVRNFDVRWELYPRPGEVLSVAVFAKGFKDPIERVYLGTSGTRLITFVNADKAVNYGAEIEIRKNLGGLGDWLAPFTAFANATVMESDITLPRGAGFTDERAMVGQAPYVINAGLTYANDSGAASATVLYNLIGKRIHSAAEAPLPDVYEHARHMVDVSMRFPFFAGLNAKLDVRNLLDSPFEVTQGVATRESYRTGRVLSVGLSWSR